MISYLLTSCYLSLGSLWLGAHICKWAADPRELRCQRAAE